jgi:hypothetical protein
MKRQALTVAAVMTAVLLMVAGCTQSTTTTAPGGKELTVKVPKDVSVKRGDKAAVKVSVTRKGFEDPVDVTFEDLPKGVTVEESKPQIEKGASEATFHLKAADEAQVEKKMAKVTASGGGMKAAPQEIEIDVKDK